MKTLLVLTSFTIGVSVGLVWPTRAVTYAPSTLKVTPVVTQTTLHVRPIDQRPLTEPMDIQPALGVRVLQNTYNPQGQ